MPPLNTALARELVARTRIGALPWPAGSCGCGRSGRNLRERGTQELRGECLAENAGMAALAREIGFAVAPAVDNRLTLRLALSPAVSA